MRSPERIARWGIALLVASTALSARGYDRLFLPLNAAVGQADAVVVAVIRSAPDVVTTMQGGSTADVRVTRVLDGEVAKGPLTVRLDAMQVHAIGVMKSGEKFVLFLSAVRDDLRTVLLDGTRSYEAKYAAGIADTARRLPGWSKPVQGLSALAVPVAFEVVETDDVDLWLGYRNVTGEPIELRYRTWPLAARTSWRLEVRHEDGEPIAPRPHPHVTKAEIEDYFSKHGHRFDLKIAPGEAYFFPLQRINSAKPGWGYKERLEFAYYPMAKAGKYTITVRGHNLLGQNGVFVAEPVTVRVRTGGKGAKPSAPGP